MTLSPGTHLGQYEILSPLGAGGMGEVYRARDSHLGREVAIKVLPAELTGDPAARRRFEQEARAVALLSHSNILSIHHFDTCDGISFAVTELLEGETLGGRIERSAIPWRKACEIAGAICDGLAAAHDKGIIHRDLKPSNIFLTSRGEVKILDFGLARVNEGLEPGDTTDVKTAPGTVLGTLGYMSPEQLRGDSIDARSDIFALGCILYQMLSGRSPFARSTASETMAAALRDEPPDLPAREAPPALMRVIRRCLEKDRHARYQSARDLAIDLRSLGIERATARRAPLVIAVIGAVAIIAIAAFVLTRRHAAAPSDEVRSVLVIPFENGSRDANVEYLSDGIAEGLIDKLAELPNLRVVGRTTAFHFKGKPVDLDAIRKQLDVDAVLSGRLVSAANAIVVQADLIDTARGTELWGNRFQAQGANVLDIEQSMVGRIADALRGRLTPAVQTRVTTPATRNPEAYRLYLEGRFYWNKRTPEAISRARDLFQQAVALDPQFALAYSGLADSYNMLSNGRFRVLPREEGFRRAKESAQAALRLDPDLAEAHSSLGLIEMNEFHWAPAQRELKRALQLNPNYANALIWYSLLLLAQNHLDESLAVLRQAVESDPLSPVVLDNLAGHLNSVGKYDEALADAQKAMELEPDSQGAYEMMGWAYEGLQKPAQAASTYEKAASLAGAPGEREVFLVQANVILGNLAEAKKYVQILEQRAIRGEVPHTTLGLAYLKIGNHDKALEQLNLGFQAREPNLRDKIHMKFKELRGDPRYEELLRRLERGFDD